MRCAYYELWITNSNNYFSYSHQTCRTPRDIQIKYEEEVWVSVWGNIKAGKPNDAEWDLHRALHKRVRVERSIMSMRWDRLRHNPGDSNRGHTDQMQWHLQTFTWTRQSHQNCADKGSRWHWKNSLCAEVHPGLGWRERQSGRPAHISTAFQRNQPDEGQNSQSFGSLVFFPETKEMEISSGKYKVLFVWWSGRVSSVSGF